MRINLEKILDLNHKFNQEGFAVLYVTYIISLFIAIVTVLGALFLFQVRSVVKDEQSLKAFFIAETGLEEGSFRYLNGATISCPLQGICDPKPFVSTTTSDGSSYEVYIKNDATNEQCILTSIGRFQNFVRTVEVEYLSKCQ